MQLVVYKNDQIHWGDKRQGSDFFMCSEFVVTLCVCILQDQANGSEQSSSKSDVSAGNSLAACSSNGISVNKHTEAASRHRKTTADAKPNRVLVKRWPKKVKSSVKGKSQTVTLPLQYGEELPVEIIFTQSTVDIVWQVNLQFAFTRFV